MTASPFSLRIAVAFVRTWTRVYTIGLPAPLRERRIAEIESDLWEHCHDSADPAGDSLAIFGRLVCGIPDDLGWRVACFGVDAHADRWVLATILAVAVLTSSIWMVTAARTSLPPAPAPPNLLLRVSYPPPPPPPPPPCNPPGIGRAPFAPCTPY